MGTQIFTVEGEHGEVARFYATDGGSISMRTPSGVSLGFSSHEEWTEYWRQLGNALVYAPAKAKVSA